ncbi:unnamed protein product [Symbiodinium sp. CCMP2592]|nr:unnamed protein product [Symbiodinium sp. CCMP2592]
MEDLLQSLARVQAGRRIWEYLDLQDQFQVAQVHTAWLLDVQWSIFGDSIHQFSCARATDLIWAFLVPRDRKTVQAVHELWHSDIRWFVYHEGANYVSSDDTPRAAG